MLSETMERSGRDGTCAAETSRARGAGAPGERRKRGGGSRWLAALAVATAGVTGASAAVIHVDSAAAPNGDGQTWATAFRSLQDALAVAGAGDEVRIAGGVQRPDQSEFGHATPGDRAASFVLVNGAAVRGGYAGSANPGDPDANDPVAYVTTLSGDLLQNDGTGLGGTDNSFHVVRAAGAGSATFSLAGVTIRGGRADAAGDEGGGAIRIAGGTFTLESCILTLNHAPAASSSTTGLGGNGGAVRADNATLTVSECVFSNNRGGDAVSVSGTPNGGAGGAIYANATELVALNSTFLGNAGGRGVPQIFSPPGGNGGNGGAVCVTGGSGWFEACEFSENRGGACNYNCSAGFGGAIFANDGALTLLNCTLSMNTGGGFASGANGVSAGNGGALAARSAVVTLWDCEVVSNQTLGGASGTSPGWGGAADLRDCTSTIVNSTISQNSAGGGASGSSNGGGGAPGGGLCVRGVGSLTIVNSKFIANYSGTGGSVNQASGHPGPGGPGGGVALLDGTPATIIGSVFSENRTGFGGFNFGAMSYAAAGYGGGLAAGNGNATLRNCTFVRNSTGYFPGIHPSTGVGGGAFLGNASSVADSIFWGNQHQADVSDQAAQVHGSGFTVNYSLIQGWTGSLGGSGNSGSDPFFANSAGGDYHLSPGSPAIDAGNNAAVPADAFDIDGDGDTAEPLPVDLDGLPRFFDDPATPDTGVGTAPIVDRGAYEFQVTGTPCAEDCNGDGQVDLIDLAMLLSCFGGGACCDSNGDGVTDLEDLAALLSEFGQPCL